METEEKKIFVPTLFQKVERLTNLWTKATREYFHNMAYDLEYRAANENKVINLHNDYIRAFHIAETTELVNELKARIIKNINVDEATTEIILNTEFKDLFYDVNPGEHCTVFEEVD